MAHYMDVRDYPRDAAEFRRLRDARIAGYYRRTQWTRRLLKAYRRALGWFGYKIMTALYPAIVDPRIAELIRVERSLLGGAFDAWFSYLRPARLHVPFLPTRIRRMHGAARRVFQEG